MSTALVLGAQLDPPPGPISSSNTLRGQHTMPAPSVSASSSAQSHWSQPQVTAATHHNSASAYSTYSSPAYASASPHQAHHLSSYNSPGQQPSHLGYTGYGSHTAASTAAQQHNTSEPPTPVTSSRPTLNGNGGGPGASPVHSPQVPATSSASSAATGGLNIAGMLNQPLSNGLSSASSHSYSSSRYGSNQATPVSHAEHQSGYFASTTNGTMNGKRGLGAAENGWKFEAEKTANLWIEHLRNWAIIPVDEGNEMDALIPLVWGKKPTPEMLDFMGGMPVSAPTSTYHSQGGYMPAMTSQAPTHPGLHTPGLSTGVSGMGISPSTGMGVPVYSHLPIGNRHRVTTTLWEDEGTLCFQVDAKGVCVARRNDNNMINGTKLLNVCGMTRGKRDGILKNEKERIVVKVGAMHLKGVWISFERAKALAEQNEILEILYPLFEHNLHDFLYQPHPQTEYPRANLGMQGGAQERNPQRQRVMGPMSGVPSSTSMSPPLSVPSTMSQSVATTLSMGPYSAPITSYPGISNVTHPPLMRSQTTPSFAVPMPRQSPIVTSSPNAPWGQPPATTYHTSQPGYHTSQSPSVAQVSSFHYPSQYGNASTGSMSGPGTGREEDSLGGAMPRPASVDRRHTDPLGVPGIGDGPAQQQQQQHPEGSWYSSSSAASSSTRLPPALPSTSSSTSSSSGAGAGAGAGGRGASGSVSSVNGAPPHLRRTSGLKRSHDASD
ncbi:hypothetical protein OC834_003275 [Tilletia horrida]|nr:hypothetical protein OC834_003275 [Tilletia horrida]